MSKVKIKTRINDMNLAQKFSLALLMFLILPIILVSILVNNYISAYDFKQSYGARLALLRQMAQRVEIFTNDLEYVSTNILSDLETQNLLKQFRNPALEENERQKLVIDYNVQPLIRSLSFVDSISLYDDRGIIYQYGRRVLEENMQFYSGITTLNGRPFWTAAYRQSFTAATFSGYAGEEYVISLQRVINDLFSFQHALGIERITVSESYIASLYAGLSIENSHMFIADINGNIVSSTDKSLLGTNVIESLVSLKDESGMYEQGNEVILYGRIYVPNWTLVLSAPKSAFLPGKLEIRILTIINIILTLLFGAAFLVLQNKTVIRPVVRLSSEAKNFRDGSFSIITHTESGDEIGNLNRSLQEMSGYIKNLIDIKYKSELSQREIELEYLQSQVNPHFLYNTLDSIRWMAVLRQQPEIAGQIEALSNLFRHSLNSGEKYTTLKKEVEHLRAYVQIQKIRFEDNMSFQIDVDEALFPCKIIKLMIQPLVENAVVHGLEPKCGKGHVHIIIDEWETKLRCRVIDDGVGIDVEAVSKYIAGESGAGKPFALKNIQNRINLEYGEGYGLCVTRSKDGGTAVQILLPIIM